MGNALEGEEEKFEEEKSEDEGKYDVPSSARRRDMSRKQLARYDGKDEMPAYIGLNGDIFDVTQEDEPDILLRDFEDDYGKNVDNVDEDIVEQFHGRYKYLGRYVKSRKISQQELREADGEDGNPIYVAAKGVVFDMTDKGESFYGPGGGYHVFAGRNAQRALALMSLKQEDVDNTNIDDLDESELQVLDDWVNKYYEKYTMIGTLESE